MVRGTWCRRLALVPRSPRVAVVRVPRLVRIPRVRRPRAPFARAGSPRVRGLCRFRVQALGELWAVVGHLVPRIGSPQSSPPLLSPTPLVLPPVLSLSLTPPLSSLAPLLSSLASLLCLLSVPRCPVVRSWLRCYSSLWPWRWW